ncbi:MAG: FumA C-terminus/TtdB family hydratase beta subunit [Candidatus Pacebacteria bacterium]|nr:FumA C-terminus/TtdB family hydratase beta subunit [Candidatus Paceibacterota bacterium]
MPDSPIKNPNPEFHPIFKLGPSETVYDRLEGIPTDLVTRETLGGGSWLRIKPEAFRLIAKQGFYDIAHYLRPSHLAMMRAALDDPEATVNDRFVIYDLLKNACISAAGVLPMCQDTGTAIIVGKKGHRIITDGREEQYLSQGILDTYLQDNLRYSQVSAMTMFEEVNTGNNLPAQIDLYADQGCERGDEYHFTMVAKGGGSANKSFFYQQTPAILNPARLLPWLSEQMKAIGTSACPPYHLAVVIGGTSAEMTMKTLKMVTTKYYDSLPCHGDGHGSAFRDLDLEKQLLAMSREIGIGAQFGGKYFCYDVRVVRLPRHSASMPIAIGVSCAADRQIQGKITADGLFLERLERDPARFLPEVEEATLGGSVVAIDLNQPMAEILKTLSLHPIKTRVSLTGTLIVARDLVHLKLKERLDRGEPLPQYFKDHMIYYAGPAKTPTGMASGAFGPTTAGRMDSYIEQFMAAGGTMVSLAKGNRSQLVVDACKKHGGFYLGSIGGPAARVALDCIRKIEVLDYAELGMEAVWRIEVQNFPAFIVIDDKGNDFFQQLKP